MGNIHYIFGNRKEKKATLKLYRCGSSFERDTQAFNKDKRENPQTCYSFFYLGDRFKDDFNFILSNYIYLPNNLNQTGLLT